MNEILVWVGFHTSEELNLNYDVMKKEILVVPKGIRYISEWSSSEDGYSLKNYQYPHIVNKQLTGCGFTEYCLTCNQDVIVCSPRRILLENKEDQHTWEVVFFFCKEI